MHYEYKNTVDLGDRVRRRLERRGRGRLYSEEQEWEQWENSKKRDKETTEEREREQWENSKKSDKETSEEEWEHVGE
jgi:hypothetical protein